MEENTNNHNLWIKLTPKHVDDNFEELINYFHNTIPKNDDYFYLKTKEILRERVEIYINNISKIGLTFLDYPKEPSPELRAEHDHKIKLLGLYLLTNPQQERLINQAYALQQLLISPLCSAEYAQKIAQNALRTLACNKIENIGYTWSNIFENKHTETRDSLAELIIKNTNSNIEIVEDKPLYFFSKGYATLSPKHLILSINTPYDNFPQGKKSLTLMQEQIGLYSPCEIDHNNLDSIKTAIESYIQSLIELNSTTLPQNRYKANDIATVKVIQKDYQNIIVETTDPSYHKIQGKIKDFTIPHLNFQDFRTLIPIGYEFEAEIIHTKVGHTFHIKETMLKFITENYAQVNTTLLGTCTKATENEHTLWITETGITVRTYDNEQKFKIGDWRNLIIIQVPTNGLIAAEVIGNEDDINTNSIFTNHNIVKQRLIKKFGHEAKNISEELATLTPIDLALYTKGIFLYQKHLRKPSERYKILCIIAILCKMIKDETSFQMVDFITQFIRYIIYFTQENYDKIDEIHPHEYIKDAIGIEQKIDIIKILKNFNQLTDPAFIIRKINGNDPILAKLAKMVQSHYHLKDFLPKSTLLNDIHREIINQLNIDIELTNGLEEEKGIFLGNEDFSKEFKTSFIYPPDYGMQPGPTIQKDNIFKSVSGFLNSNSGGTIYVGVNDLGYIVGIEEDLKYLKCKTIDSYIRYIQDELNKSFPQKIIKDIKISSIYENQVISIHIPASIDEIVPYKDNNYIRINAETRKMDNETYSKIFQQRYNKHHNISNIESQLKLAIQQKRSVLLKDYQSNNSNSCRDRHVEPHTFITNNQLITCLDLEDFKNKNFALSRIKAVEIRAETYQHENMHKKIETDIFKMAYTNNCYEITLHLDSTAKTLLLEETSATEDILTDNGDNSWTLQTNIFQFKGAARFCLGLWEHICILGGEEFTEYIKEEIKKLTENTNHFLI